LITSDEVCDVIIIKRRKQCPAVRRKREKRLPIIRERREEDKTGIRKRFDLIDLERLAKNISQSLLI